MLVDINLIPKKEKRNPRFFIYLILLLLIAAVAGVLFYWQYSIQKESVQRIDKQILQVREATATVEQNILNTQSSSNSITELHRVIDWADSFPIDTVFLLQHLTTLLPDRGFFDEFIYKEDASIELTIQFDTTRQSANYLTGLTKSNLIASASLVSVKSDESGKTEDSNIDEDTSSYLPRYLAVYNIVLNQEALKEAVKEDEEEQVGEKGGTSE